MNDSKLTQLFTEGELTASQSQRQKIYDQLQVEWNKNLPLISLYQRPNVATAADSVVNFAPGGPGSGAFVGLDFWNAADYGMKPAAS